MFGAVRPHSRVAGVHFILLTDTRVTTSSRCAGQKTGARASLQLNSRDQKSVSCPYLCCSVWGMFLGFTFVTILLS